MRKPTVQATTRLAGQPCVNPSCKNTFNARATHHLCGKCDRHWRRYQVPTGGFIVSSDLKHISKLVIADLNPSTANVTAALRIVRGTRHREGPWADRPAYRLQPLLHGRWNTRLPHLLVGRRSAPSLIGLINTIVHYHLAEQIIGSGGQYSFYLAGATFYGRRSAIAPKGAEVMTGDKKSAGYRLTVVDFSTIGQTCLRAGKVLGMDPKDRSVSDRIVSLYAASLDAANCYRPVVIPFGTFPTKASGDHPLDHMFSPLAPVPARYKGAIRRASGLIKGAWPEGLDLSWEEREHLRLEPSPNPYSTKTTEHLPETGWIFAMP